MMRLRPYKPCDAETILSWVKDEWTFRRWVTDRYPHYPITAEEMNHKYLECNGDCVDEDNFYPMTAFTEHGVVGHLILRFTDAEKRVLRFGFVIVDDSLRGAGYGKQMLRLALDYASRILKARKVTLGVLENNPGAYHCYRAVGFRDVTQEEPAYYHLMGEDVKCLELEWEESCNQERDAKNDTITLATEADLAAVRKLDSHIPAQRLAACIEAGQVYVLRNCDDVIGVCRYSLFWQTIPFLDLLYIAESHRGMGYGKQMMAFWEKTMAEAGHRHVMLSTQENETAKFFYEKLGYRCTGSFLPPDQEDGELMYGKELRT